MANFRALFKHSALLLAENDAACAKYTRMNQRASGVHATISHPIVPWFWYRLIAKEIEEKGMKLAYERQYNLLEFSFLSLIYSSMRLSSVSFEGR